MKPTRRWHCLFLFAVLAAVGSCTDTTGPASSAPPEDLTIGVGTGSERLYGNAELVTPVDPNAARVPDAWSSWISANAIPVRSLTSHRYDDLKFLQTVLGGRRLVQLGESGHGVREFNQAKVRLIRFLHEEMGFDVIAFESGLYECWNADRDAATAPSDSTMRRCIFGVWHTAEVMELFEYIRQTRATSRPLRLAGFDVQFSSVNDTSAADFLSGAVAHVDASYATRVRALESTFYREYRRLSYLLPAVQTWRDSIIALIQNNNLISAYDSVVAFLRVNEAVIASKSASQTEALVARQTAFSRSQFVRQMSTTDAGIGFEIRDAGMAANVDFLVDELYSDSKVVLWAHNAHIQHDRRAMRPLNGFGSYTRSMGTWVSQRHRAELYTIGLYMYTGTAAMNDRKVYTITRALDNSLEALFYTGRMKWLFTDMLSAPQTAGTEWMDTYTIGKEWGVTDYRIIPRQQYDGILFIHTVSPPQYR